MKKYNALPPSPTWGDRIKYAFSCPPHGKVGEVLTQVVQLLLVWGALYAITGDAAAPGGHIFSLLVVFVCSVMGGKVTEACGLPALLGMLLAGIALRSIPGVKIIGDSLNPSWSASIRKMALVVILLRAGLGLDPKALKTMSLTVFRLAFVPSLVESTTVAIVAHFLLGFPWLWSFMLGFIVAAISPSVVVPCLLQLSQQGYGVDKGIPTLVIAAATLDDVLAISGFGLMLGMTFSEGSLTWQLLHGPLEVLMGLSYGAMMGFICWILPNEHHQSRSFQQFTILISAGFFALFGSQKINFGGAGALAVLCMAFIAGIGFRRQSGGDKNLVGQHFTVAWGYLMPMLFALMGTEIQIMQLELDTIWLGVALLCISLTCRVVTTFFVVLGSGLNIRERFFVALAWLPKATIQAAIGSTALDYAVRIGADETEIALAKKVLTIVVLVILISAPIGAIAIMTSAPRLLQRAIQPAPSTSV
ncbi:sodium/hydrogen exchanger 9B2 [Hyalella azteca]|uniref:Sodium/hydrogen exchanger 9B2 n=1 Tax=Hyalella azteca TaxID=294128 RepID=A0A8B7N4C0_HYAAZ|nr:sodium/hydrogen exchanger 9B2 [Hyalella azteca]XP_018008692.1 sodium/hydrogen exchanger 9B2 [Hyalella azteca]